MVSGESVRCLIAFNYLIIEAGKSPHQMQGQRAAAPVFVRYLVHDGLCFFAAFEYKSLPCKAWLERDNLTESSSSYSLADIWHLSQGH